MKITVKLFATLRAYHEKIMVLEVPEDATVEAVIRSLEIPVHEVTIMMRNGRGVKLDASLSEDDVLSLFPPVGGG